MKYFVRVFSGITVSIILLIVLGGLAALLHAMTLKVFLLTAIAFGFFYAVGYIFEKVENKWL